MDDVAVINRTHRVIMTNATLGRVSSSSNGDSKQQQQLRKRAGTNDHNNNGHHVVLDGDNSARSGSSSNNKLQRSSSAPARQRGSPTNNRRHLVVEDHYRIDPEYKTLLPGLPKYNQDDWAMESHDFFNLIALVPVVVLNVLNWNWDIILGDVLFSSSGGSIIKTTAITSTTTTTTTTTTMQQAWTGEYFPLFYAVTIGYFIADLIWVCLVPHCVKSPSVIIQHHVATLLYLIIPYMYPQDEWLMGACLSVEINTWLLIARRVFNKQGFGPWVINLNSCLGGVTTTLFAPVRIKVISILFYITWFAIRCYIYPQIMYILFTLWYADYGKNNSSGVVVGAGSSSSYYYYGGSLFNSHYCICLLLQSIFVILNFKWTFDLFASKVRAMRSNKSGTTTKIEKGL